MDLFPCARCSRHVRVGAACCPFCGGALPPVEATPVEVPRGTSRAALLALGATLALGACGSPSCGKDDAGAVPAPPYGVFPVTIPSTTPLPEVPSAPASAPPASSPPAVPPAPSSSARRGR